MTKLSLPLKTFGGKFYLAPSLCLLFPEHRHYVEPFFGGGSVLLAKDPNGVSEVANDIYGLLTNFWMVLASPKLIDRFLSRVQLMPFCEKIWDDAYRHVNGPIDLSRGPSVRLAASFFTVCRQSRSGQCKSFASLSRERTRGGMNEQVSAWLSAVKNLPEVHKRLQRVVVYNRDALGVISSEDTPGTCFYCDPPYMHETRVATNVYEHEMSADQHRELLRLIRNVKGRVMISGYRSPMYDKLLKDWNFDQLSISNHASGAKIKPTKTECIWMNYEPPMSWEEARALAKKKSGSKGERPAA